MKRLALGAAALLLCGGFANVAVAAAVSVNGGAVKSVQTVTNTSQATTSQLVFTFVPGALKTINVPAGGDTAIITFSAECSLTGNTNPLNNWIELEIRDNNVPIGPTGDGADPLALCSTSAYTATSLQAVKRLTQGAHQIKVMWKIVKHNGDTLNGYLDDYTLSVLVAE